MLLSAKEIAVTNDRQVSWLVDHRSTVPSRSLAVAKPFDEERTVVLTASLPTYSGGTAPVFHRTSLFTFGHSKDLTFYLILTYIVIMREIITDVKYLPHIFIVVSCTVKFG